MPQFQPFARHEMLVGQQYKLVGWTLVAQIKCTCHPEAPLMLVANGAIATCALCHRSFAHKSFQHDFEKDVGGLAIATVIVSVRDREQPNQN